MPLYELVPAEDNPSRRAKIIFLVLAAGVAIAGVGYFLTRSAGDPQAQSSLSLSPGISRSYSSLVLNDRQVMWLNRFRAKASTNIVPHITITSGVRGYEGQAKAMLDYLASYGEERFKSLYGRAAAELLKYARNVSTWTPVVKWLYDIDYLHKEGHLSGGSVDLRKGTPASDAELIRAALAAGARKAYDDGPCIHVDLPA